MHQHSGALEQKWNRPDPFFQWVRKMWSGDETTTPDSRVLLLCGYNTTSDHNEKTEAYSTRVAYYFFNLYMGLDT